MKNIGERLLSIFLCVWIMLPSLVFVTGATELPYLFSLDDYTNNETLAGMVTPYKQGFGIGLTYDSENSVHLAASTGTASMNTVLFDINNDKIDTTQEHWFCGKTLEYEVDLRVLADPNPLFEVGIYSQGTKTGYTSFVYSNYGENIWWYPTQGIVVSNSYPISSVHDCIRVVCNEKAVGVTRRFKMTETEEGIFQYYLDGTEWKLLAEYARNEMIYTKGNPFICCRKADTYGIKTFVVYNTPEDEKPTLRRTDEVFSTKSNSDQMRLLKGNTSDPQYNEETDTISVAISGASLNMTRMTLGNAVNFDSDHWLKNKTIEFEIVLQTLTSTNPVFEISVYSVQGNTTAAAKNLNYGTNMWWYTKRGILVDSTDNTVANNTAGAVTAAVFGSQGESLKIRITENESGMFFYYYCLEDAEWKILKSFDTDKLPFTRGMIRFQGRGGDVYGIRGFRIYNNKVDMKYVQDAKSGNLYDVRFIAALNDLNVSSAGMMISAIYGDNSVAEVKVYNIGTVFTSLNASDKSGTITTVAAEEGTYFMPQAIHGIPIGDVGTVTFHVIPFVEKDGSRMDGIGYFVTYDETGTFVSFVPEGGLLP